MRRRARVDANQQQIIKALRQVGATVQPIHMVGQGVPDIAVGFRGMNFFLEIKDENQPPNKQKLTVDEQEWHIAWKGQVAIVKSVDEALRAIGAIT